MAPMRALLFVKEGVINFSFSCLQSHFSFSLSFYGHSQYSLVLASICNERRFFFSCSQDISRYSKQEMCVLPSGSYTLCDSFNKSILNVFKYLSFKKKICTHENMKHKKLQFKALLTNQLKHVNTYWHNCFPKTHTRTHACTHTHTHTHTKFNRKVGQMIHEGQGGLSLCLRAGTHGPIPRWVLAVVENVVFVSCACLNL